MNSLFSSSDTPLTMWEFCSLARISPTTYHADFAKGAIYRSCSPFGSKRATFRYSSFADLVSYIFAKEYLPTSWSTVQKCEFADLLIDALSHVLEMQDHGYEYWKVRDRVISLLLSDRTSFDRHFFASDPQLNKLEVMYFTCRFLSCWSEKNEEFRLILERELQNDGVPVVVS